MTLVCEDKNENLYEFEKLGCKVFYIGSNLISNFIQINKLLYSVKPTIVLNFTLKSIFIFTLVNIFFNIKNISTFSGLGYLFIKKKYIYNLLITLIYLFSSSKYSTFLFHNNSDLKYFKKFNFIKKIKLINISGSGVNSEYFNSFEFPDKLKETNFLMVSRLIKEKGVMEFCYAAKEILKLKQNISFTLIGKTDVSNPGKIKSKDFKKYVVDAGIRYIEDSNDIKSFIDKSHCIVLPSYREGLSKFLLEGMSMSRPIITTDVPGCKELVNNENGFICRARDYEHLKTQIIKFSNLSKLEMKKMGQVSRKIIMQKYEMSKINNKFFQIINSI